MHLPESIRLHLKDASFSLDSLGRSQAQVMLFTIEVSIVMRH